MKKRRRQLTLFVNDESNAIESIRLRFNPIQYHLIAAHVTLCREDELDQLENVIENIKNLNTKQPISLEFGRAEKFDNGQGVLLPAKVENKEFYQLRNEILKGIIAVPRNSLAHITLMHPRNSTCNDVIFKAILETELPTVLIFNKLSLIEQKEDEKWLTIAEFLL